MRTRTQRAMGRVVRAHRIRRWAARGTLVALVVGSPTSTVIAGRDPMEGVLFVPVVPFGPRSAALTTSGAPGSATTGRDRATAGTSTVPVDPGDYADRLVRAWGRGDRAEVAERATGPVAAGLFAVASPGGRTWVRVRTETSGGGVLVAYRDPRRGQDISLGVDTLATSGDHHLVYRLIVMPRGLASPGPSTRIDRACTAPPVEGR